MVLLLQPSPPRHRAQCSAPSCPHEHRQARRSYTITDDYRVSTGGIGHEYYHVSYLEEMLDLTTLSSTIQSRQRGVPMEWKFILALGSDVPEMSGE
jgi:hypothetical protein